MGNWTVKGSVTILC